MVRWSATSKPRPHIMDKNYWVDSGCLAGPPFTLVKVDALEAGEDFAEFLQEYYPHLLDPSGRINPGQLIRFDSVPELVQKINRQFGKKVYFSEGQLIIPVDILENHNGSGTFMLSADESQDLLSILGEYGFSAAAGKHYDPMGYWDYVAFSVQPIPEVELVRMQYQRLSFKSPFRPHV